MGFDFSSVVKRLQSLAADGLLFIPRLFIALIVFAVSIILARYVRDLTQRLVRSSNRPENLAVLLSRLARWTIISLGALFGLLVAFPGFTAGQFVQLLGLGGLAAGIAFRSIFEDFLAGIILLLHEPFAVGDQIVVQGYEGTIEDIEARTTAVRTYDGRRVVVPNSQLFINIVTVNTAYPFRRIEYDFGIGYGDDIEKARSVILKTLDEIEEVEKRPEPEVIVMELGNYNVILRVRWWIRPPRRRNALDARNRVLTQVSVALLQNGIDLPFPTQQILFHDQTEATDGNRRQQREGWPAGPDKVPEPYRIADALLIAHRRAGRRDASNGDEGEQGG